MLSFIQIYPNQKYNLKGLTYSPSIIGRFQFQMV
jgi:hypothetical protein